MQALTVADNRRKETSPEIHKSFKLKGCTQYQVSSTISGAMSIWVIYVSVACAPLIYT